VQRLFAKSVCRNGPTNKHIKTATYTHKHKKIQKKTVKYNDKMETLRNANTQ